MNTHASKPRMEEKRDFIRARMTWNPEHLAEEMVRVGLYSCNSGIRDLTTSIMNQKRRIAAEATSGQKPISVDQVPEPPRAPQTSTQTPRRKLMEAIKDIKAKKPREFTIDHDVWVLELTPELRTLMQAVYKL